MSEWWFAHHKLRPAIEKFVAGENKAGKNITLRFWDAQEHPKWGYRKGEFKGDGYVLYDKLCAMYKDKSVKPKVNITVALHNNASRNKNYGGTMMIYRIEKEPDGPYEDDLGKALATKLQAAFVKMFPQMKDRRIRGDQGKWVNRNLGFTRWGYAHEAVPVIAEFGFMSYAKDRDVMLLEDTPDKYAKALITAIEQYAIEESQ